MKHEVSDASFGHRLHIWRLNTEVGRPERHASLGCTHPVEKISQGHIYYCKGKSQFPPCTVAQIFLHSL